MSREEFLKLSDLDKVKYTIEESLKVHKHYKNEYWKGSAFMGESILQTIEQVKKFTITDVSQQSELYCFECEIEMPTKVDNKSVLRCGNCGLKH